MKQTQEQARGVSSLHVLIGATIVGIMLFILLEVIVQWLPPHYNPLSQSESDLAVGPYGFLMALGFAIGGMLLLLFLIAYRRVIPKASQSRSGLILLGVAAICKWVITFVATDLTSPPQTIHGKIHAIVALISFFCAALGELLIARSLLLHAVKMHPSPRFLAGWASVTLIWSVLVIGTAVVSTQIGVWGLLERIATGLSLAWVLMVSLGLWQYLSLTETSAQRITAHAEREQQKQDVLLRVR